MFLASTMQDFPLTITAILRHGATVYRDSECVTWTGASATRANYAEVAANAERLAAALAKLGVRAGDRVATFAWNNQEHLEAYFAVPCMGAVLHTLNIRLFPEQLSHIVNHAEDRFVIVDGSLIPLLARVVRELTTVEAFIVVGEGDVSLLGGKPVLRYHELIAAEEPGFAWPEIDERAAAAMCYTSGTTGDPKGVVYSHRSTFLHAQALLSATVSGITEADRVLAIVPMFHVNAWGLPYGSFLGGADLLMPGPFLQPEPIARFVHQEKASVLSGVPTIWQALLAYGESHDIDLSTLRTGTSGGAAAPRSLFEKFEQRYGLRIIQGWGMTETSPLGGMAWPPPGVEEGTTEDLDWRMKSGRIPAGVQMRIVDANGAELPWDGEATGEIEVRGPWITGSYYRDRRTGEVRRRLAAHRRHRHHRPARFLPVDRPREGRDQVRWRVDFLGGAGKPPDGPPCCAGGRGDRRPRPPLGRATTRVRGGPGGRRGRRRGTRHVPGRPGRQMAGAGELDVRRGDPQDHRRQVRQEAAARPVRGRRGHRHQNGLEVAQIGLLGSRRPGTSSAASSSVTMTRSWLPPAPCTDAPGRRSLIERPTCATS